MKFRPRFLWHTERVHCIFNVADKQGRPATKLMGLDCKVEMRFDLAQCISSGPLCAASFATVSVPASVYGTSTESGIGGLCLQQASKFRMAPEFLSILKVQTVAAQGLLANMDCCVDLQIHF